MKKIVLFLCLLFLAQNLCSAGYVRGYYRRGGTYVSPHYRSSNRSMYPRNYNSAKNIYKPYKTPKAQKNHYAPGTHINHRRNYTYY